MSNFKISAYEEVLMFTKIQKALVENRLIFQIECGFNPSSLENELEVLNNMLLALTEGKQFYLNDKRTNQEMFDKIISERSDYNKEVLKCYYKGEIEHTKPYKKLEELKVQKGG